MSTASTLPFESMRTEETQDIERFLEPHFLQVSSYRFNSASIRIRVIDPRFAGLSREQRDGMVEPYLDQLPPETQKDILMLLTFAPADLERPPATFREFMLNVEFEHPSPSML